MVRNRFVWLVALMTASWFVPAIKSQAVGPTVRSVADNTKRTKSGSELADLDQELDAAARRLVHEHLNELKVVLEHLRANHPQQYKRAITDLARSARRLESAKNRDEQLFEIEVESLKAQTSLDLLTAKLKVRDNESDRKQLRKAVGRLQRAQITRAKYDVEALQTRLKRTEQQLSNAQQRLKTKQEGLDDQFEKTYVGILRKAGRLPLESSDSETESRPRRKAGTSANSPKSANVKKRVDKNPVDKNNND